MVDKRQTPSSPADPNAAPHKHDKVPSLEIAPEGHGPPPRLEVNEQRTKTHGQKKH
ncbi:MAG: hypothetical protein ABI743_01095 [bacterium]